MLKWFIWAAIVAIAWFGFVRADSMPLAQLPYYDARYPRGGEVGDVGGDCESDKCLLIYLAPWCPQCRAARQLVLDSVKELPKYGVETMVVLGSDERAALKEYAAEFPFPIYLDADKTLYDQLETQGVPYFVAWKRGGKITKDLAGRPHALEDLVGLLELAP